MWLDAMEQSLRRYAGLKRAAQLLDELCYCSVLVQPAEVMMMAAYWDQPGQQPEWHMLVLSHEV